MRVTCPECEATYELPAELAAKLPVNVRCVRCGNTWEIQVPACQTVSLPVAAVGDTAVPEADAKSAANIESKSEQESAPAPVTAQAETPPAAPTAPAAAKSHVAATQAGAAANTAARPHGEGKAAVGLVEAAPSLPVPESVVARPEESGEAEEAEEDATLPASVVRTQWVISLVALAAMVALILVLHRPIGHVWPQMLRVYHALGLN